MGRPRTIVRDTTTRRIVKRAIADVERGAAAVNHVGTQVGNHCTANHITVLLAGLRHWCDAHGQDYGALERKAYNVYSAELAKLRCEETQEHNRAPLKEVA